MTYEQRTYRGLDAERNPRDASTIAHRIAAIRAAKAAAGEPTREPTIAEIVAGKRVYRLRSRRR
jgi:hypothetical protein